MTLLTRRAAHRRQVLMTREAFERFAANQKHPVEVCVRRPYDLVPCHCGDVNCDGWRFVERQDA